MYFTCLNQVEAEIPACSQSLPPFPLNRHSTYRTTMSRCREKVDKIRPTTHQSTMVAYPSSKVPTHTQPLYPSKYVTSQVPQKSWSVTTTFPTSKHPALVTLAWPLSLYARAPVCVRATTARHSTPQHSSKRQRRRQWLVRAFGSHMTSCMQ